MVKKNNVWIGLLLIVTMTPFSLFALSGGGDGRSIPVPDVDFSATFTDMRNISTAATKITWDGKIFIEVQRGSYAVTVPFDKIRTITVDMNTIDKDGNVSAEIVTTTETIRIKTDGDKYFFGKTKYGTFRIFFKNIKLVRFVK